MGSTDDTTAKPGDFILVTYGSWGTSRQLAVVVGRARDGERWRVRKYLRKSNRWTGVRLIDPAEIIDSDPESYPYTKAARIALATPESR